MKIVIYTNSTVSKEFEIPDDSPKAKAILEYFEDKRVYRQAIQDGTLKGYYERTGKERVNAVQLLFGQRQRK